MSWSDKARKASADARKSEGKKLPGYVQRIQDKAASLNMTPDEYSKKHGYKSHEEHIQLLAPRTGKDKNRYRPSSMGKW